MRFLVDESSGKKLFHFLLDKHHDVKFVSDFMPGALDSDVLRFADKEERVLITNDKDFGELVFRLKMHSSGVILLRLKDERPANKIYYIRYLLNYFPEKLENYFIVVRDATIRMRKI